MFRNAFWFTAGVVTTFVSCTTFVTYYGRKNPGLFETVINDHLAS